MAAPSVHHSARFVAPGGPTDVRPAESPAASFTLPSLIEEPASPDVAMVAPSQTNFQQFCATFIDEAFALARQIPEADQPWARDLLDGLTSSVNALVHIMKISTTWAALPSDVLDLPAMRAQSAVIQMAINEAINGVQGWALRAMRRLGDMARGEIPGQTEDLRETDTLTTAHCSRQQANSETIGNLAPEDSCLQRVARLTGKLWGLLCLAIDFVAQVRVLAMAACAIVGGGKSLVGETPAAI